MLNYTVVIKKNINFVELNENTQLYLGWEIPIVDVKVDKSKSYSYWEFSEFGCLTYEVKEHNFGADFLCRKIIE